MAAYLNPRQVRRDNSDLFRYDRALATALRKDRFSPSQPEKINRFCEAAGIHGFEDPFPELEFRIDLETFMDTLSPIDAAVLRGYLCGYSQTEIALAIGRCQQGVSQRLRSVLGRFREFYQEDIDIE